MQVLMITSEWPSTLRPYAAPFIVQQVEDVRRAGVDVDVFAFRGRKNPFSYARAWRAMRRRHDLSAVDVVHAQFGQSGLLALPARAPLVVTFHGSDVQGIVGPSGRYTVAGRVLRRVSRYVARRADAVILVAEHLRPYVPPHPATYVLPTGIDMDLFRPMSQDEARQRLGLPPDRRLVLFAAGALKPVKRYPLAEQAVALLQDRFDVDLLLLSGKAREEVPVYMNAADALVLTSRHEGSPNVIREALACNLPVVSVDVGDVRQRLARVEGCVVCSDDAPETIAEALARVLQDRRRVRGREAVADLDARHIAQRLVEVYQSVMMPRRVVAGI